MSQQTKPPGLVSVIFLSISTMVGSGWLFASFYAAQSAGSASIFSWLVGAAFALLMALLLSEIAVRYPVNSLVTRLTTLSHNVHFGFVTAISNWLLGLIVVPSEAIATTQYLATAYLPWHDWIVMHGQLTWVGIGFAVIFMLMYFIANYWGVRVLTRVNNLVTVFKLGIPLLTIILLFVSSFHAHNFVAYQGHFMPYGITNVFSTVVSCGILYSFFGFHAAATFSVELENPQRNVPIALIVSICSVLCLYLLLQVVFIGALPSGMLTQGWHHLNFTSPLAQLATLLGLNFLAVILYVDACISPSGTGLVYLGTTSRILTEMSKHDQVPRMVGSSSGTHGAFSRRALLLSFLCSVVLIMFFRNWKLIASLVSVFVLIAFLALPISYCRFKMQSPEEFKLRLLPFPKIISFILYLVVTYLLMTSSTKNLVVAFALHIVFFFFYVLMRVKVHRSAGLLTAWVSIRSSWTIFLYMFLLVVFSVCQVDVFAINPLYSLLVVLLFLITYFMMLHQKFYWA